MPKQGDQSAHADDRDRLRADCASCFALCCVALPLLASADFAIDKPAGVPCPNLASDFRCGIHTTLRQQGFPGCTAYDCFGAGQQVAQVTFGGRSWRESPETARQMFDVFPVMQQLHELLWYVADALSRLAARETHAELGRARDELVRLTLAPPEDLASLDVATYRAEVNVLLLRTSDVVRADLAGTSKDHRGADLIGAALAGADLRGASLRGAYLIGADLRRANLRLADVLGADFRAAELAGADLSDSLFLTQGQVGAARGDAGTQLPTTLIRPSHWGR